MTKITITIEDQALHKRLDALMSVLTDTRPMMAGIAQALATQTELAFQDEGPGWPQLRPGTIKRRGSAHPILQVSNALARSISSRAGADYAQVGANKPVEYERRYFQSQAGV